MTNEKLKALNAYIDSSEGLSPYNLIEPKDDDPDNFTLTMKEGTFSKEYLILTYDEAMDKAKDYIKETLWAFNADFILPFIGAPLACKESFIDMQARCCESLNPFLLGILEDNGRLDDLIKDAIFSDTMGHFLATYDGKEIEQDGFLIYRTN